MFSCHCNTRAWTWKHYRSSYRRQSNIRTLTWHCLDYEVYSISVFLIWMQIYINLVFVCVTQAAQAAERTHHNHILRFMLMCLVSNVYRLQRRVQFLAEEESGCLKKFDFSTHRIWNLEFGIYHFRKEETILVFDYEFRRFHLYCNRWECYLIRCI